jgi:Predicted integral membrane protein (DUF2269)
VLAAAGSGHRTVFDVFVVLHVVCAVVGFGAVAISGVYGATARRPGRPGAEEETARYFGARGLPELLVLAVPVFGGIALGLRPDGAEVTSVWVLGGLGAWLAAALLLLAVVRPAERRLRASPTGESAVASGGRLMWAASGSDVLFVVALALMITQPR